jgi:putative Ca2+/H+ antiporter (TMEM165/GDT1 family)
VSCLFPQSLPAWTSDTLAAAGHWAAPAGSSFALVLLAEVGDKSQLVCMTLAARFRALPVLSGATLAFAVLNLLAVAFGGAISEKLPHVWVGMAVAALFIAFGLRSLFSRTREDNTPDKPETGYRNLFLTVFFLILVAEFGDKTQLAVAGMSTYLSAAPVWAGATLALTVSACLGIWIGRSLLTRLPLSWLHRISGVIFLGFGFYAAWHVHTELPIPDWGVWFSR